MWILFFLVGGLGFLVCLVTLIIQSIRKKPKKVAAILMAVFLIMGVSSMVYAMSTPAIDPSTVVANGEIVDADLIYEKEITFDDNNNAKFSIYEEDEKQFALATCDFDGTNVERELSIMIAIVSATQKKEIQDLTMVVTSGNDTGMYIYKNGELSDSSLIPEKYTDKTLDTKNQEDTIVFVLSELGIE